MKNDIYFCYISRTFLKNKKVLANSKSSGSFSGSGNCTFSVFSMKSIQVVSSLTFGALKIKKYEYENVDYPFPEIQCVNHNI